MGPLHKQPWRQVADIMPIKLAKECVAVSIEVKIIYWYQKTRRACEESIFVQVCQLLVIVINRISDTRPVIAWMETVYRH